ncbi:MULTISPECIES: hypothetical protein [unclassified Moorena]|uniref:hypothetical protein n=1 Tax=unclassified Moorena TaxID=2683338 RepID=UPI0013CDA426|nr:MULTISPECIES: hypothetical protein [unclassified Moorena]NEO24129.1 hypothetical protein [Moorena sp. SIO4A5]
MFVSIIVHCSHIRCSLFPTTAAKSIIAKTKLTAASPKSSLTWWVERASFRYP